VKVGNCVALPDWTPYENCERCTRAAPRNSTRADVREHRARLKRISYIINKQCRSSAAACDGASRADGARQPMPVFTTVKDAGSKSRQSAILPKNSKDSHGARCSDATTSPGGGAAGV